MDFNNLICALLFFCICVEALRFPGSVDGRIRRCLLEGLKRLHSNSAPLKTPIWNDSKDSSILSNYPVELKQVFLGNLDFKSIKKLSQCNKQAALLSSPSIAQRLATFNPHFVFDDELVNSLLLAVLDKHFPNSKNLQSETIHDELQLFIMKYSRDDLNFDSIPKNIYFYLISFINESVHGVDSIFDGSIQHFCILLLRFKIPESCSYFRQFFADDFFDHSLDKSWKHHLEFFSQNPLKEDVRRHFEIPADINDWIKPRKIDDEFIKVILELFYDEFTDDNVVKFYDAFDMNYSVFSKAFIRRYFSIIDEDELMRAHNDLFTSNINRAIICTELSVRFGKTIDTCYFSTRNSLNELSLDRLASFDSETILKQLKLYSYSDSRIYDFELVVTVINSDLITPKLRIEILKHYFYVYRCYDVVELLIKETNQPIKYIEYRPLTNFIGQLPEKIFLEFVNSINDPFICLIILEDCSFYFRRAKHIVQKKDLNLNKVYIIDLILNYNLRQFVGRTMHFKQILKELNDPKLNEAFNLDSNDLTKDYSAIESLPVIIVDNDYTFTPNSH
jgi:hypothetical protein